MNLQKVKTGITERMSKGERQQYYKYMEEHISSLAYQDQIKIEFAKRFVTDLQLYKEEDGNRIQIGPLDKKSLEYFIFAILVDYARVVTES